MLNPSLFILWLAFNLQFNQVIHNSISLLVLLTSVYVFFLHVMRTRFFPGIRKTKQLRLIPAGYIQSQSINLPLCVMCN